MCGEAEFFKKKKKYFKELHEALQCNYFTLSKPVGHTFLKILRLNTKQHLKPLSGIGIGAECCFRQFLSNSETDNLVSTPTQYSILCFTQLLPSLFKFIIKGNTTNTFIETLSKSMHQVYKVSCLAPFFPPTFEYGHLEA